MKKDLEWIGEPGSYELAAQGGDGMAFADGSPIGLSTSWAIQARRILGSRAQIFGFYCHDNPAAGSMAQMTSSHDFVLVDNRYILDGWLCENNSNITSPVVDMWDPEQRSATAPYYGEPENWTRIGGLERDVDMETTEERQVAFTSILAPQMGLYRFFRPVCAWEALETIEAEEHDPEDYIFMLSDARMGGSLRDDVEDMATEISDRANAWARCSEQAEFDNFTLGLARADEPDQIISMVTLGIEAQGKHMTARIEMLFTDAEFRGEGYGRLISGAAIVMLQRAVRQWEALPDSAGDMPETIQIDADPVSDGGAALVDTIEEAMDAYLDAYSDTLEPA